MLERFFTRYRGCTQYEMVQGQKLSPCLLGEMKSFGYVSCSNLLILVNEALRDSQMDRRSLHSCFYRLHPFYSDLKLALSVTNLNRQKISLSFFSCLVLPSPFLLCFS